MTAACVKFLRAPRKVLLANLAFRLRIITDLRRKNAKLERRLAAKVAR